MPFPVTEHVAKADGHTTFYLACGPDDGPLIIFVHGWPELSISWRHQLRALAALGFRAIAPDMRGYGRSSVYAAHEDYALEPIVGDMLALLASLGRDKALWVGHDWGSPVVWSMASHHPDRCEAIANLCVPYLPDGFSVPAIVPLVDRALYPEDVFPYGQWDYQVAYVENFDRITKSFEANVAGTVRALFRAADPAAATKPSRSASIRKMGDWFGGTGRAPDLPLDTRIVNESDAAAYTAALGRNGFFGPDSWYMNGERNAEYAKTSVNDGRIDMPVLFLHASYDAICMTEGTKLPGPMRAACTNLTERSVACGHWMAQERPVDVNRALVAFIAAQRPSLLQ
jgi:pimeloyl-ACP methyl ester carboxylesterase